MDEFSEFFAGSSRSVGAQMSAATAVISAHFLQLKVALDLLIEFPVLALLVEQTANPQKQFAKLSHGNSSFITKCHHEIDLCRAASWQPTGQ